MPESDDQRTFAVIQDWCGVSPTDASETLIDLWEETRNNQHRPHTALDFQPDGVEDLLNRLKKEFLKSPGRRIILTPKSFDPNGRIKTILDLINAVDVSDSLALASTGVDTDFPALLPGELDDETARLYGVVASWCGDYPTHTTEPLIEIWERTRASALPHKNVPYLPDAIQRLIDLLKEDYGSKAAGASKPKDYSSKGNIKDCASLLRVLHFSGTQSGVQGGNG